jgi:hypothetical protein
VVAGVDRGAEAALEVGGDAGGGGEDAAIQGLVEALDQATGGVEEALGAASRGAAADGGEGELAGEGAGDACELSCL